MNKSEKKIIIITLIMFILSPIITYILLMIIDNIILPRFSFLAIEGNKEAWIQFAGSIIGGTMTMLALFFTVKMENEKTETNKAREIRPFIVCNPSFLENFESTINREEDNVQYPISLVVENISNNLVKDLKLESEIVYEFNPKTQKYDIENQSLVEENETYYCIYTVLLDSIEMVKPNNTFSFQTNFLIGNYREASKISCHKFKVIATYKYRDILDIVEYTHYLEYELIINYTNTAEFFLFTNAIQNKTINETKILNNH